MQNSGFLLTILGVFALVSAADSQTVTDSSEQARAREIYSQKAGIDIKAQAATGSGQPAFKGGTMIAKNAAGNYEVCNIIGYQSVIGAPPALYAPFVICPSDAAAALASNLKEEAAQRA
jgi:hypothetical protein